MGCGKTRIAICQTRPNHGRRNDCVIIALSGRCPVPGCSIPQFLPKYNDEERYNERTIPRAVYHTLGLRSRCGPVVGWGMRLLALPRARYEQSWQAALKMYPNVDLPGCGFGNQLPPRHPHLLRKDPRQDTKRQAGTMPCTRLVRSMSLQ